MPPEPATPPKLDAAPWQAVANAIEQGLARLPASTVPLPPLPPPQANPSSWNAAQALDEFLRRNQVETARSAVLWSQTGGWPAMSPEAAAGVRLMLSKMNDFVGTLITGPIARPHTIFPFPDVPQPSVLLWLIVEWWPAVGYPKTLFEVGGNTPRFGSSAS